MCEGFERDSKGPTEYFYGIFTDKYGVRLSAATVNLIHCTRLIQTIEQGEELQSISRAESGPWGQTRAGSGGQSDQLFLSGARHDHAIHE